MTNYHNITQNGNQIPYKDKFQTKFSNSTCRSNKQSQNSVRNFPQKSGKECKHVYAESACFCFYYQTS